MDITEFLNEQYSDAALYILYRAVPSYVDGLKNAARKVVYVSRTQNLKAPIKVSNYGSKIIENAEYLHGDSGIQGTIVTMAKYYCGTGLLPVLEGVGSFGTRFSPYASAPRYIFAKPADYFDLLFRKEDDPNLIEQEFEGKKIEPVFYVPTLPLILLNGSEGIGVGFSASIFPRSIENVIAMTRAAIAGKKLKNEWFVPSWKGFKGTIEPSVDKEGKSAWTIKGIAKIEKKRAYIDELPMDWDLGSYRKHLEKCKEKGIAVRFNDFSEDDVFKFEVLLTDAELAKPEEQIWKDLGLISSMTETLACFDENNEIRDTYKDVKEIFNDYFKIKIKYLKLRIKSETVRLLKEESDLKEMYDFIQEVIKGTVALKDRKKADVEAELKKKGYTIVEKLVAMPLYSITIDKAKEIEKKWKDKIKERQTMEKETPENLWSKDIDELEKELTKEGFIGDTQAEVAIEKAITRKRGKKEDGNGKR